MRLRWPLAFGNYRFIYRHNALIGYITYSWLTVDDAGTPSIRFRTWQFNVRCHNDH